MHKYMRNYERRWTYFALAENWIQQISRSSFVWNSNISEERYECRRPRTYSAKRRPRTKSTWRCAWHLNAWDECYKQMTTNDQPRISSRTLALVLSIPSSAGGGDAVTPSCVLERERRGPSPQGHMDQVGGRIGMWIYIIICSEGISCTLCVPRRLCSGHMGTSTTTQGSEWEAWPLRFSEVQSLGVVTKFGGIDPDKVVLAAMLGIMEGEAQCTGTRRKEGKL